jgi:drug/metabolite transporter (DMT)-like permease
MSNLATQEPDDVVGSDVAWLQKPDAESQHLSGMVAAVALCIALLGIACGSIFFVFANREMSPNGIAFNRLLVAAIAFAIWNGLQYINQPQPTEIAVEPPVQQPIHLREWGMLFVAGASFVSFLVVLAWSLTHTTVANAALLTHMMPIFTTLGAWVFLGRRFSTRFLVGMMVAVLGAIAIGVEDLSGGNNNLLGDLAALLAAVLFATEILVVEQLRTRFPTTIITMGECAIGVLLALPAVLFSHESVFPPSWKSGAAVLGLAVITQMLGHGMLTYSLKQFSAGFVSVALLAVPLIAAVLALVIFAQTISVFNGLAFLVVLIGIYLSVSAPIGDAS